MTHVMPGAPIIELGVPDAEVRTRGGRNRRELLRRPLLTAALGLCLFALAASAPGHPVLGSPLWTGSVSLNGFTLGTRKPLCGEAGRQGGDRTRSGHRSATVESRRHRPSAVRQLSR